MDQTIRNVRRWLLRMGTPRLAEVAFAFSAAACVAGTASSRELVTELQRLQIRDHLSLAQVYGSELTVIRFGSEPWLKDLETERHYFYGVAFKPGEGSFVGSTDMGLVAMDLDGHILWKDAAVPRPEGLAWSPDGKKLAFAGPDRTTGIYGVQLLDIATHRRSVIAVGGRQPGWIALDKVGYCLEGRLRVQDLNSGQSMALGRGIGPSWSATVAMVAYRLDDGDSNVHIRGVAPDSELVRTVAGKDALVGRGDWSPDGKYLSFVAKGSGRPFDLGLDCLEPKRMIVLRVADGATAGVHTMCKGAPARFSWATVGPW